MKNNRLTKLIEDFGMEYELKPLLESPKDYLRFERIINDCLEGYKDNPPKIKMLKFAYYGFFEPHIVYSFRKPKPETYARMINDFKMHYGIDVEKPMKKAEISRHEGVSKQIINKRLDYVLRLLSMHKRDIWYDML